MSRATSARTTVGQWIRFLSEGSDHAWTEQNKSDFDRWFARLCLWPPNVFAITATILHQSGLYRVEGEPDTSSVAPRELATQWNQALAGQVVIDAVRGPSSSPASCCDGRSPIELPSGLIELRDLLWQAFKLEIGAKDRAASNAVRHGLIRLHCVADEACVGMGTPAALRDWKPPNLRSSVPPDSAEARNGEPWLSLDTHQLDAGVRRLVTRGTLSCFEAVKIKILPKKRTPQVGITLRSISIWVGAVHGEVDVSWFTRSRRVNSNDKRTNLLLIPWPLELTPAAFSEVNSSRYRQFEYHPPSFATTQHLRALLRETKRMGLPIDGMIFPEQALLSSDFERLRSAVKKEAPDAFILAGVQSQGAKHPRNEAWLAVDNDVRKQEKHHRWSLTASQIRQYHLGGALHADDEGAYWERMTVGPRSIAFAHLKPRLTLCHLICEDLARVEPVAEVVRAVGPNLVIALLLDGPQLEKRWPGRYASIFADDPGSSVLTLSALGMVRRCVPVGEQESRVVALWKDALTGGHELSMASGVDALVLSLSTNFATERTFDGRQDERSTGVLAFSGLNEVRLKR